MRPLLLHLAFVVFFIFLGISVEAKNKVPSIKTRPSLQNYLIGNYRASQNQDFRVVNALYSDQQKHYLRKEVAQYFEKMAEAASKVKISLRVVSAFRSFDRQKKIWESKFLGFTLVENKNLLQTYPKSPKKRVLLILKYSAAPGTSRHHWGTDLDINATSPEYFETDAGKKVYQWLKENANKFGFFQPYTQGRKQGYQEEKWHWSYQPLGTFVLEQYKKTITKTPPFQGSESLPEGFYEDYILGFNHEYW
jgi:LAS superfamily LD-carboxypeptidase LdcB